MKLLRNAAAAVMLSAFALGAAAQSGPMPYGAPISLDMAKKAMAAAEAEAKKNNWPVVITIVDSGGHVVLTQRLDNTQYASLDIAKGKAQTALNFRRPTKVMEDAIAGGGAALRLLALDNITPLEGGILITAEGKIIGAIGVSGVTSQQDAQVAKAGVDALTAKP